MLTVKCTYFHADTYFFMAKKIQGLHVHLHPFQTPEVSNPKLIWPTWIQNTSSTNHTYCSVFSQLAERGEGFLVSFSDLLSEIIQLCCHFIVFCGLLLWRFLLLFVPIISDSCRRTSTDHMWLLRSPHVMLVDLLLNTATFLTWIIQVEIKTLYAQRILTQA